MVAWATVFNAPSRRGNIDVAISRSIHFSRITKRQSDPSWDNPRWSNHILRQRSALRKIGSSPSDRTAVSSQPRPALTQSSNANDRSYSPFEQSWVYFISFVFAFAAGTSSFAQGSTRESMRALRSVPSIRKNPHLSPFLFDWTPALCGPACAIASAFSIVPDMLDPPADLPEAHGSPQNCLSVFAVPLVIRFAMFAHERFHS